MARLGPRRSSARKHAARGHSYGFSVYRATVADGAEHVGMTGQTVLDRLETHFGAHPHRDAFAPPLAKATAFGLRTHEIVQRAAAVVRWTVAVRASASPSAKRESENGPRLRT